MWYISSKRRSLAAVNQGNLYWFFVFLSRFGEFVPEVTDGVGEDALPEIRVNILSRPPSRLHQIPWNVQETPDLEQQVDQAQRSDSQWIHEGAHRYPMDEDEHPEQGRTQPYIMQNFSQNQERTGPVAETEPYHLHEGQDNSEDV